MGRRNQSNVPAQALIMMNDPLVVEQSKAWAQRILDERLASSRERIDTMYQMAFARPANEQELLKAQEYIAEQSRSRAISQDDVSLWTELAHAMVNLKEFIYIR
jgi:Protein of unknown function (DUF1553)